MKQTNLLVFQMILSLSLSGHANGTAPRCDAEMGKNQSVEFVEKTTSGNEQKVELKIVKGKLVLVRTYLENNHVNQETIREGENFKILLFDPARKLIIARGDSIVVFKVQQTDYKYPIRISRVDLASAPMVDTIVVGNGNSDFFVALPVSKDESNLRYTGVGLFKITGDEIVPMNVAGANSGRPEFTELYSPGYTNTMSRIQSRRAALDPQAKRLALIKDDSTLSIYDLTDLVEKDGILQYREVINIPVEKTEDLFHPKYPADFAFNADGNKLALIYPNGSLRIFSYYQGEWKADYRTRTGTRQLVRTLTFQTGVKFFYDFRFERTSFDQDTLVYRVGSSGKEERIPLK